LTKLALKMTRSDDPDATKRAAESAEKITSEVLDKVIVPSTLLDMILRPQEYADPSKLSEVTVKVGDKQTTKLGPRILTRGRSSRPPLYTAWPPFSSLQLCSSLVGGIKSMEMVVL
jgi:hypothetical protein